MRRFWPILLLLLPHVAWAVGGEPEQKPAPEIIVIETPAAESAGMSIATIITAITGLVVAVTGLLALWFKFRGKKPAPNETEQDQKDLSAAIDDAVGASNAKQLDGDE